MKGIRQPHSDIVRAGMIELRIAPIIAANITATCWLPDCHAHQTSRCPGVAISERYTDTPPSSTPAENPCSNRPRTTITGARMPIVRYAGVQAITSVPMAIRNSVRSVPSACRGDPRTTPGPRFSAAASGSPLRTSRASTSEKRIGCSKGKLRWRCTTHSRRTP